MRGSPSDARARPRARRNATLLDVEVAVTHSHASMMERLLIHPPFADPTQPYLSLPTLKGSLRARGLDARVLDLNVEAAHWLFSPETMTNVARRIGSRFIDLNREQELDFEEQREYRALVEARAKIERAIGADPSPIAVFRTRELFYDAAQYSIARRLVEGYFEALSAAHFPYRFSFNHAAHSVVPWSFDLLEEYAEESKSPLDEFYRSRFQPLDEWEWSEDEPAPIDLEAARFIGISIVFPSQIPEAFALCKLLRERAPQAFLALGGPGIHQVVVHMEPELQARVLEHVDGVVLFEGEESLAELFPKLAEWQRTPGFQARFERSERRETESANGSRGEPTRASGTEAADGNRERFELLREVPNLLLFDRIANAPVLGPRRTLDLREAASPDYSDLDLDRYLAPSRTLLYSPTRGCYWNQCSFCYYGLAETATASYREIPAERAAADLAQLARRHGVKNFYISCDVLAPKYAVALAQALIDRNLKIRWSSDLKIEKYFTPERCELLFRSGLRSAAFGIESGSDRILELMRKGCDRATMTAVNRAFHDAGVATEWMTFTDHPDETLDEALATVQWIEEEQEYVDLFIVGEFGLERGSHIAQDPARYGVRKVYYAAGDELRLYALFTHKNGRRSREASQRIEREIGRVGAPYDLHPYPWAGANSTHHTFLHFLELGQRAFRNHFQRAGAALHGALPPPPHVHITGLRERPRFSIELIAKNEAEFFGRYLQRAMYTTLPACGASGESREVAPLAIADYSAAAGRVGRLSAGRIRGLSQPRD
jgi:radical SAM superfamily enzyme YgiQ (UPF0313 family)